jgi:uncharacterized metal-binding protein
MASGRAHHGATLLVGIGGAATLLALGEPTGHVLAYAGGCFAGLVITPDLDVDNPVHSHYVIRRSGGCLIGSLWYGLWRPYARLIRHRAPLSHWPLLGTAGRLLYMGLIAWLVGLLFGYRPWPLPAWFPWAVYGLALADILHWWLDTIHLRPWIKRKLHKEHT